MGCSWRPAWMTVGLVVAACGAGRTQLGEPADVGDASVSSSDGGAPCPTAMPSQGATCSVPMVCEYGQSLALPCNSVAQCTSARTGAPMSWSIDPPTESACACPPYDSIQVNHACDQRVEETCFYPQGVCGCSLTWSCFTPGPGCPTARPLLGTPCPEAGLRCDYGGCVPPSSSFGFTEICDQGRWTTRNITCD